jgi:hypothetical protein
MEVLVMQDVVTAERPPIIGVWQARGLIDLMRKFYSDPENQAAYEKWKAERERRGNSEQRGG